jgi:membrane protein implicated in regulation of membrane protease activity
MTLPDSISNEYETNVAPPIDKGGSMSKTQTQALIWIILLAVIILGAIITGVYFLVQPGVNTGMVRDIFLIFLAVEFLVIGLAMVILTIQLATLINLLNNEIKPILNSTQETIDTLRGTTEFLSANLVAPIIKLNEYMAGIRKFVDVINIFK